jgi:hypothetical protein
MDGGKISQEDRWWPARWWRGHWLRHRRKDGQWADGAGARAAKKHEAAQARKARAGRRVSRNEHAAIEYQTYLEGRQQQADNATRGHAPDAYFTGRPRSVNTAPEELRDWFRDHGPNLTASEFRRQSGGGGWFGSGEQQVSSKWFG